MVVRGERFFVVGESAVVAYIAPSHDRPLTVETFKPGQQADLLKLSLSGKRSRKSGAGYRLAASESTGGD